MVPFAMSIQHKPHLDVQAKAVEGKLHASVGELAGDIGQNLQGDVEQAQAFVLKVGQAVEDIFKPLVDRAKSRATQVFHQQLTGQQWPCITLSLSLGSTRRLACLPWFGSGRI